MLLKKVRGGHFYRRIPFKRNLWKPKNFAKKSGGGGQIYKGNPFKRNFWKPQNYSQKLHTEDPILLYTKFKNRHYPKDFFVVDAIVQLSNNIKPKIKLFCIFRLYSVLRNRNINDLIYTFMFQKNKELFCRYSHSLSLHFTHSQAAG